MMCVWRGTCQGFAAKITGSRETYALNTMCLCMKLQNNN